VNKRVVALIVVVGLVAILAPLVGRKVQSNAGEKPQAKNEQGRRKDADKQRKKSRHKDNPVVVGRLHKSYQPTSGKLFVLVIGSDARSGNPNLRADALHLVGLNTKTMRGGILNFPRDSWVPIPGRGSGKINEALYLGGPELQARTVESLTGIKIDYYVLTGFQGFQSIVKALGGVRIRIRRGIFDPGGSGAKIKAGTKELNPPSALAFVRTRKAFPHGDIDRTTNQGRFLLALLRQLRSEVSANPAALLKWIATGKQHTRLNISITETFRLAVLASQVSPQKVGNVTVPVSLGSVGAASVVFISPAAKKIYRRFKKTGSL
jgi:polyisoprenyl-teichoic acid--peptidoglycan teichoic acid transferase